MTGIIISYFITILISKGVDLYHAALVMKDLTDAGYKLKYETINEDIHKMIKIKDDYWYIPFYNIYDSFKNYFEYINNKSELLYQEYTYDRVQELNPREKRKYEENPSMLNAYLLEYKMENIREKCNSISLSDGSKIYYTMDLENGLKFVDCLGPSEYRDEKQLTSYLIDGYSLILDEYKNNILEKDLNEEELKQKINDIEETKQWLLKAKEDLMNIKNDNNKTKVLKQS